MKRRLLVIIPAALLALVVLIVLAVSFRKASCKLRGTNFISASALLSQAKEMEAKNNLIEAKNLYQRLINDFFNSSEVMNWEKKLEELNIRLLFSPVITAKSMLYEVKPGDTLAKIAKNYKTTTELIIKSNNLASDRIVPGKKIKVWTAPFNILVDKSQNTLMLKSGEEIIKIYIVSTGKNNTTPAGNFKITNKLINPPWFKKGAVIPAGSPENILGTRWMGFDIPEYGIHGTTDPQSLGKQVTQGCVRMSNAQVEELYTIIPVGTEVTVVD